MLSCCYATAMIAARRSPNAQVARSCFLSEIYSEALAVQRGKHTEQRRPSQATMSDGIRRARSVQLKYLATLHQIGKPLEEPIVGRHFKLPERPRPAVHPVFDMSLLYIPIYCHLVLHPPEEILRPPTPELITRARMEKAVENWMD